MVMEVLLGEAELQPVSAFSMQQNLSIVVTPQDPASWLQYRGGLIPVYSGHPSGPSKGSCDCRRGQEFVLTTGSTEVSIV